MKKKLGVLSVRRAITVVFLANCAALVLELVAGRLLAPYVGASLITWTAIIGIALAGISVGNWLGGHLADRWPRARTMRALLLLASLSTLGALGIVGLLDDGAFLRPVPLLLRTFLLTAVVFFPPNLLIGMVTPVVIRLVLPDVGSTGRTVGLVYATGTLGSLAGNFLTGFVLVAYLPVTAIVLLASATLVLLSLLAGSSALRLAAIVPVAGAHAGLPGSRNEAGLARDPAGNTPLAGARDGTLLAGNLPLACTVVAVASFCTMAIELAASRFLAPYVGVSLYSWTGIIGVVLAAIALGNYLGGRLADLWPRQWLLALSLFLGGLACLSILFVGNDLAQRGVFNDLGLLQRIMALTAAIFFAPVLLLGTISPQVIKLAVFDVVHAGRVAGRIYAWSTAGAIAGTFATGWVLISLLGVNALTLLASLGLIAVAVFVGRLWRQRPVLVVAAAVTVLAVVSLGLRGGLSSSCTKETNYFCIKVGEQVRNGVPVKTLVLDHLLHSYVKIGDPSYLGYEHEYVQSEVARFVSKAVPRPHVLVIGGGGYTFPRWVEAFLPAASVEVVELDPGVTEVDYRYLGLPRDTRIVTHNLDGRQFVDELAPRKYYDLIVQDAVNDLSVPYHILTREYNDHIRQILREDGVYLLTIIDLHHDGQLMRSAARTMMETFPQVQLLAAGPAWDNAGAGLFVLYGSNRRLDVEEMREVLRAEGAGQLWTAVQPDEGLRAYVAEGPQIVLTDQYAPVDNLISLLFRSRT